MYSHQFTLIYTSPGITRHPTHLYHSFIQDKTKKKKGKNNSRKTKNNFFSPNPSPPRLVTQTQHTTTQHTTHITPTPAHTIHNPRPLPHPALPAHTLVTLLLIRVRRASHGPRKRELKHASLSQMVRPPVRCFMSFFFL